MNPGTAVKHAAFARGVTVHQSSGVTSLLLAQVGQSATTTSNALIAPGPVAAATTAERWAELVAVLLLIGVVIFRLAILPGARWSGGLATEAADRARRLGVAALVLFMVTTFVRAVAQSAILAPAITSRLVAVLTLARDTSWGHGWAVGAAGAIVMAIGLITARRAFGGWLLAGLGVIAICLGEGLTGHTASGIARHSSLSLAADVAHFLGAGGWLGGLAAVTLSGIPSLRRLGESEAASAGSRLVRSYHGAALECVALVLVTAVIAAWLRLSRFSALWTTAYGQMLLLKIAAVLIVMVFGWYQWRRVVQPEWRNRTRRAFRRSAAAELLVGAVVVAITAVLVSIPLPK